MKTVLLFALTAYFFASAIAQPAPDTLWTRTYGGSGTDKAYAVQQTADGGYIIAGETDSFGAVDNDIYIVRTNDVGDTLWTRSYGGQNYDVASSVHTVPDGGFIAAGYSYSFGTGDQDFYVVRVSSSGDTLWTKSYGGPDYDVACAVYPTSDSGFVIAGKTMSFGNGSMDYYLIKSNSLGDTLWTRTYGSSENDICMAMSPTSDGGYILAGYSSSLIDFETVVYLVRTDSTGNVLWSNHYEEESRLRAYSIQQTEDGGFIVAGVIDSPVMSIWNGYLLKTDNQGNTLWTRSYGGYEGITLRTVHQLLDGGYVMAGDFSPFWGSPVSCLMKTDQNGDSLWIEEYCEGIYNQSRASLITSEGSFILAGYKNSVTTSHIDFYLIKTDPYPQGNEPIQANIPEQYSLYPCYPNPFNASTTISFNLPQSAPVRLNLYNTLGQSVRQLVNERLIQGYHSVNFNAEDLPSGIYLVRMDTEEYFSTQKMVLIK